MGAAKKATQLGAKVITISGPDGYIYDPRVSATRKLTICSTAQQR
jgi:glutamate dehydrogenase/leucine dehydrogenase